MDTLTTPREELATVLKQSEANQSSLERRQSFHLQTADDLLAAGYRKPRTVEATEELDALGRGSVVIDRDGDAWQRVGRRWTCTERGFNTAEQPSSTLAIVLSPLVVVHEVEAAK